MRLPNCLLVQTDARPHGGDTGLHLDTQAPRSLPAIFPGDKGTVGPTGLAASACRGRTRSASRPLLPGPRPRPRLSRVRPPPGRAPPASPRAAAAKAWRSGISPAPLPALDSRSGTGHAQSPEPVLVSTSLSSLLLPWTPGRPGSAGERPGQRQRRATSGCAAPAARPAAATAAAAATASAAGAGSRVRCALRSRRRAGRVARRLRAHSLTSIPLASRRSLSLGSPGLAGPGGGEGVGGGAPGWGLRRGKVRAGAGGEERTPPSLAPASAVLLGSSSWGGSALLPGSWRRRWLLGVSDASNREIKGGKVHFPLGGRERFN
ncbi:translation initiation factor IF-2-like [Mustela erminea]|uniref:translation initiation factor IF-2-like n=1 Tax=Mustela erminea TaxID=36723 RepID=UPI001386E856|nr:translation initiation factor IF-2-like [Mustela erminea]